MKAVILAGGLGTRLSEETTVKPKPLLEVNGQPLLVHIMKHYARYGVKDFIILAGYKGAMISNYFKNFTHENSNVEIRTLTGDVNVIGNWAPDWNVTILYTGLKTQTAGRLLYLKDLVHEDFFLTYGDGISDVNLDKLLETHNMSEDLVTLTAVQPPARFGGLTLDNQKVLAFDEKPTDEGGWVNGGYMVIKPETLSRINTENESLESHILPILAKNGEVGFYKHVGFWQPVDTIRDLEKMNGYAQSPEGQWMSN